MVAGLGPTMPVIADADTGLVNSIPKFRILHNFFLQLWWSGDGCSYNSTIRPASQLAT